MASAINRSMCPVVKTLRNGQGFNLEVEYPFAKVAKKEKRSFERFSGGVWACQPTWLILSKMLGVSTGVTLPT